MVEDEVLKWRFKCGSRDALRRIYEKYLDLLITLAMALLNDVSEAEDVVHDVFVSFAESAHSFSLRGNLKSYLATCVINRARDRIRKYQRHPIRLDNAGLAGSDLNNPDQLLIYSEESKRLNFAIAQLPYDQREAVILHIKTGMRFKEIAKMQGVSINTAQGRYRYGLKKLRSILDSEVQK